MGTWLSMYGADVVGIRHPRLEQHKAQPGGLGPPLVAGTTMPVKSVGSIPETQPLWLHCHTKGHIRGSPHMVPGLKYQEHFLHGQPWQKQELPVLMDKPNALSVTRGRGNPQTEQRLGQANRPSSCPKALNPPDNPPSTSDNFSCCSQ